MIKFLKKLWDLNRPYKGRFLWGVFFGVLNGVSQPMVLGTVAFVFCVVFSSNSAEEAKKFAEHVPHWVPNWVLVLVSHFKDWMVAQAAGSKGVTLAVVSLVPLAMLVSSLVAYLNAYLMSWVAIRTICDLRIRLFDHLLNLPLSFLTRTSTGELMSRMGDLNVLQNTIATSLVTLINAPIRLATYLFLMVAIDWKLTIAALLVFPVCAIPISIYNRKGRKASAALQAESAVFGRLMHESFTGNRIIKAYNLEGVVVNQLKGNLKTFTSHFMRVVRATETPGPLIEFLGAIGIAAMLLHFAGRSTPEKFTVFVGSMLLMYAPIKQLIRLQSQFTQAQGATQRVFDLMAMPNTLTDPPQPAPLRAAGAEIHFDNVSFGYDKDKEMVLRDIELKIQPGQMIGLVGPTGSGKTTLTNLLLRFYDPTSGALRIGGLDIRQAALRDLRSQIAVVTQDIILFNDTIRQNIAYGRPGASLAEVESAARHANAHDFIMEKPQGYDTLIGERGVALSGGQRQRLSIARAILKNAPILILDEATSSLDNESERLVQAALDALMKGRTTLCIAHRLTTIRNADMIVVLDKGRIVETGRHEELLRHGGVYQMLHALQFQKPPPAEGGGAAGAP